jgi:hypothetical protein
MVLQACKAYSKTRKHSFKAPLINAPPKSISSQSHASLVGKARLHPLTLSGLLAPVSEGPEKLSSYELGIEHLLNIGENYRYDCSVLNTS